MHHFKLNEPDQTSSPSLVIGWETVQSNLRRMLSLAGSPTRLRPHMKTHKTREISQLYLSQGINKHKCATLREAEVLAEAGAPDVLIAYPMVGPNQKRLCELAARFPKTRFSCLGDSQEMLEQLDQQAKVSGVKLGLFVDFNVGQDRTGLLQEPAWLKELPGWMQLNLVGIHLYDGQNRSSKESERLEQIRRTWQRACDVRASLQKYASEPLEIVLGGTPAFMLLAKHIDDGHVSLSPGTCILHDAGYQQSFPELGFEPAAAVLVRCISRPGPNLVTFDVGTKAICADPPFGSRLKLVGLESAKCTLHNEEHYVVETEQADRWKPGMVTYAIPMHVCPTVAMYDKATIVEQGEPVKTIEIAARSR